MHCHLAMKDDMDKDILSIVAIRFYCNFFHESDLTFYYTSYNFLQSSNYEVCDYLYYKTLKIKVSFSFRARVSIVLILYKHCKCSNK